MLNGYKELLTKTLQEIESYEENPTKRSSLKIRKLSSQLGKDGIHLRKYLIKLDREK